MAKLLFNEEDERLIQAFIKEFEPTKDPLTKQLADALPSDAWERLCDGLRLFIRNKTTMCLAAKAFIEAGREKGVLGPAEFGRDTYDIWLVDFGFGSEVPEEFEHRLDLPMSPDGEWTLPAEFVIRVSEIIEARIQEDLLPESAQV